MMDLVYTIRKARNDRDRRECVEPNRLSLHVELDEELEDYDGAGYDDV